MGLEIKRNNIILGENTSKVYGIVKYPQDLEYGWLSRITNIPGTICSINFTPIDSGIFIENISRSINRNRGVANSAKDPLTRSRVVIFPLPFPSTSHNYPQHNTSHHPC